jgi:protein-disulfide isomerase
MLGLGIMVAGIGAMVAYSTAEEAEAYEALYEAEQYDPYAYGAYDGPSDNPYGAGANPLAAPAPSDPLGGLGAAGYGAEPEPVDPIRFVPVGTSPTEGPADALVTIVVFADYQCPFCSRVEPTLDRIRENYGDDVRIVYKNNPLPFHQDAMPAAELAFEARAQRGDDGFFEAHELLYENQHNLSRPDLERLARQLRLDGSRTRRALDNHTHRDAIQSDMDLAARVGATGTPNFFINGMQVRGAQPYEEFARVIDQQRIAATLLVASGVPRSQVYDSVMRDAVR